MRALCASSLAMKRAVELRLFKHSRMACACGIAAILALAGAERPLRKKTHMDYQYFEDERKLVTGRQMESIVVQFFLGTL